MARQWRIEYPGALYHVMSRGNAGQEIFQSDHDRSLFVDLIGDLSERFNIEVYAYVLMSNHYHLLLKTVDANLSKAMQWFGTTYTRKFNLAHHSNGHLFQGRFKSIIVENDAYLLRLSCYIHRNPLRAGIVDRLADYKWSSYPFYAYKKKPPGWLKIELILNQLSGVDRHKAYRTKVRQYSDENGSIWEDVKYGLIFGGEEFIKSLKTRFLEKETKQEIPQHNKLFREFNPDLFLKQVSEILPFDVEAARIARRISPGEKDNRDILLYLLWKTGRLSNHEIGVLLGMTYSAVSRRIKVFHDKLSVDQNLRSKYQYVKSLIKV
jgi:REP element-mobilizing transposase RayT